MAATDDRVIGQNPWWTQPSWRGNDPHLWQLEEQPMRLPSDLASDLSLVDAGIHVLRGPRQVGKSTDLKLLVDRALEEGHAPRGVIYLALDLLEGRSHAELARSVERAKQLANHSGPSLVLLDEVTLIERWQTAVKSLWDDGHIRHDVVVCTGSSAVGLQRGAAERLPGRRRAGVDHLVLPQTFASFARALDSSIPRSPRLTVADMQAPVGRAHLDEALLHGPALRGALDRYLVFGGMPAAVAEAVHGLDAPTAATKRIVYDSLVKELQRKGASVPASLALLERVVRSLGSKTNWSDMARAMDVPLGRARGGRPSHHTLKDYIELLASGYFIFITHFWRAGSASNSLSNDKKVFFADPLLHWVALDRAPGLTLDVPAMVENLVGMALLRRYEGPDRLIESFVSPDRLHIWQTSAGGEIDFVCGARGAVDVAEVKYRNNPGTKAASGAARAHPGRPVVMITKDTSQVGEKYSLIPAHLMLWALG